MIEIHVSTPTAAERTIPFAMIDLDGLPLAGATVTVKISKAGAAFATITPAITDVGHGAYWVQLAAGDVDTAGYALLQFSASGARTQLLRLRIVSGTADDFHLAKAVACNKRTHEVATGVDTIYDDDGETPLLTLTPVADVLVTAANWTNATKRVTKTGAFANYVWAVEDTITLTGGTGVTLGQFTIASRIDDDTIELSTSISAAGEDVTDNTVAGVIEPGRILVVPS